ncbi:MAG: endo alpha-1,4 polygalactosaminidase [Planctomycetota bacterium]|jgi:cysteinyl-tRNA synthetase
MVQSNVYTLIRFAVVLSICPLSACSPGSSGGTGGGGGSGDTIDPDDAVVETGPAEDSASAEAAITITFAKEADPDSVDVWIEPDDVDFIATWSGGDTILTLTPTDPLEADTEYTVFVGELTFDDGSELADEFLFSFRTADGTQGNGNENDNGGDVGNENENGDDGALAPLPLNEIGFWGYQIQAVDADGAIDALAASRYDMLVLEPTRTDAELLDFDTKGMVERLKGTMASDDTHRKLIIAYVDIGEAEDWRWYWTWSKEAEDEQIPDEVDLPGDWPGYIVARDPDGWVGNYPVAYWESEWKDIMIYGENRRPTAARNYTSALDELILDGFDGIYLDWVEGFENVAVIAAAQGDGLDPEQEMIDFIAEIGTYARQRNPDFLVIQQNAAALIEGHPDLVGEIDAIAQEGVWYDGVAGDDWDDIEGYFFNEADLTAEYLAFLAQYLAAGIPVFNCEYALVENAADAYTRSLAEGYVPYVSRRSLSRLTDTLPQTE